MRSEREHPANEPGFAVESLLNPQRPFPAQCIHYVGFRDDRFWNAYRIFGGPRFIHRWWDKRAQREIAPNDIVIFAEADKLAALSKDRADNEGFLARAYLRFRAADRGTA